MKDVIHICESCEQPWCAACSGVGPCSHGRTLCPECWIDCPACRRGWADCEEEDAS